MKCIFPGDALIVTSDLTKVEAPHISGMMRDGKLQAQ
jgi:hypothetical protein